MYVVVVGINCYRAWPKLDRAVSDARGARNAFVARGFTELRPALLDEAATGAALHRLVTDELRVVDTDDSLVVFFAGHGHTVTKTYPDGTIDKRGYLIPIDAEPPGACGRWVNLETWLHEIAHLPAKHILVVIDACHSGIALNPVIRWRGEDVRTSEPLAKLRARRSRRIITSALDDEQAMDNGPIEGHSLFTGCLIEALTGGLLAKTGQYTATGSEIALHVQRRVSSFPGGHQTPDFGALELDNRGELIIALSGTLSDHLPEPDRIQQLGDAHLGVDGILPRRYQSGQWCKVTSESPAPTSRDPIESKRSPDSGVDSIRPKRRTIDSSAGAATDKTRSTATAAGAPREPTPISISTPMASRPKTTSLDPPTAVQPAAAETASRPTRTQTSAPTSTAQPTTGTARPSGDAPTSASAHPAKHTATRSPAETTFITVLDRHQAARQNAHRVLTLVKADPMIGATGWASWAASRGLLTLVTEATGLAAVTASLLEQIPLLRMLRSARTRLAAVAGLEGNAFDEAFDSRSASEREAWIDKVAGHNLQARVAGWLLSMIRAPWGRISDLAAAPIQGGDLLAVLHGLSAPITVLFHHREPTSAWLERAIQSAAELVDFLPRCAIAVSAPDDLATSVLRAGSGSHALTLARQGEVPIAGRTIRTTDADLGRTVQILHEALARDPRTRGLFEPHSSVPTYERPVEVDLIARDALLAVEIDDWYQFHDPNAYERDRSKDVWLSRAQFFVMRFLVDDIEDRIEQTVDEIAIGLAGRRASGSFVENSNDQQD